MVLIAFAKWIKSLSGLGKTPMIPADWRSILEREVNYYSALQPQDRRLFEQRVMDFLSEVNIQGVKTQVEDIDRVLIGASAIIPIFGFKDWRYSNIREVMLYPGHFNKNFDTEGPGRTIKSMVGKGKFMEGRMILSQHALRNGFSNSSDKRNTAIHEFVHLIDKHDGKIDALPDAIHKHPYSIPWLSLIEEKSKEIHSEDSDIDAYAGTEPIEFFAVVSEYFFERPKLLQKKHPRLYGQLSTFFNQDTARLNLTRKRKEIRRNDLCHCGSGKKYKRCHFRSDNS